MPTSYYPPRVLKEAIAVARTILERNAGNPIYRITLAEELGQKPESTRLRELITASSGYGLTKGSYQAETIELTELGRQVADNDFEACLEALFSVECFAEFYSYFSGSGGAAVPSDANIEDYLTRTRGIPQRQIARVKTNLLQDAKDWYLIQNIAESDRLVPRKLAVKHAGEAVAPESADAPSEAQRDEPNKATGSVAKDTGADSRHLHEVRASPEIHLDIQIHIAADTPDSKIKVIFENMRKYLIDSE